jgi:prevent-host-death family protein
MDTRDLQHRTDRRPALSNVARTEEVALPRVMLGSSILLTTPVITLDMVIAVGMIRSVLSNASGGATGMMKTTTAIKARQNLGQLLEEAFYQGDEFIIERAGKPMAVLVPVQEFKRWQEQREKDLGIFDEVRTQTGNVGSEKVEKDVEEALSEIRKNA